MSSLILEPKTSKSFFIKYLDNCFLKRDAARYIDKLGSIFLLELITQYIFEYETRKRACEICDEKRSKKVLTSDIYEALKKLNCEDFIPILDDILAISGIFLYKIIKKKIKKKKIKKIQKFQKNHQNQILNSKNPRKLMKIPKMTLFA